MLKIDINEPREYYEYMGLFDKLLVFAAGKTAQTALPPDPNLPAKRKILVAEADENLKNQYVAMLQDDKYEIATVGDGAQGLNMLLTFKPDVMLIDLTLPVMDGKAMLHHLRALPDYKYTPVIVISDTGDTDTMRQVEVYETASAFFIKSNVTADDIISTVKQFA